MADKQHQFKLDRARWIADELVRVLAPACHQIEIAGSIRRGVALVHDIDLVAWPWRDEIQETNLFGEVHFTIGRPDKLVDAIECLWKGVIKNVSSESKILRFAYNDIPVEVYLAEPDGSNFEALYQMRTGSENHNKWLARRALYLKMSYRAGYGIYKLDENLRPSIRVDDGTERGIYQALGLTYPEPENRI